MKRIIFSLLTAAICNASSLFAQQTEKTITIQTNGQEDVIDLPEGMITTTDSLYLDWISKHYINPAENCTMTTQNYSFNLLKFNTSLNTVGSHFMLL